MYFLVLFLAVNSSWFVVPVSSPCVNSSPSPVLVYSTGAPASSSAPVSTPVILFVSNPLLLTLLTVLESFPYIPENVHIIVPVPFVPTSFAHVFALPSIPAGSSLTHAWIPPVFCLLSLCFDHPSISSY